MHSRHLEGLGIPPGFLRPEGALSPDFGATSPDFCNFRSPTGAGGLRMDFGAVDSSLSSVFWESRTGGVDKFTAGLADWLEAAGLEVGGGAAGLEVGGGAAGLEVGVGTEDLADCPDDLGDEAGGLGDGDCPVEREGDLVVAGVGSVLPLDFAGARGVGDEVVEPGNEATPEERPFAVLFGIAGSSVECWQLVERGTSVPGFLLQDESLLIPC